jgi:hypothetical protein
MEDKTSKYLKQLGELLEGGNSPKHIIDSETTRVFLVKELAHRIEEDTSSALSALCLGRNLEPVAKLESYKTEKVSVLSNPTKSYIFTEKAEVGFKNDIEYDMFAFVNLAVDIDSFLAAHWESATYNNETPSFCQETIAKYALLDLGIFEKVRYSVLWNKYLLIQGYIPIAGRMYSSRPMNGTETILVEADSLVIGRIPNSEFFYLRRVDQ